MARSPNPKGAQRSAGLPGALDGGFRPVRKALLFDDLFAFCDFVRLHGSGARSASGYRLYYLEHPRHPHRHLLALVGFNPRGISLLKLRRFKIRVDEEKAHLRWEKEHRELAIRREEQEQTLLALIRLAPLSAETRSIEARSAEGDEHDHLLFWLHGDRQMAPLVTACLRLGNDRIRFATLEGATLLRIEQPSYFLVQQVVEDLEGEVELFYRGAEDLYLPWGLAHPLIDLWRQSEQSREKAWVFFRPDGSRLHLEPPRWHDIYNATKFEIDLGDQPLRRQVTAEHRFPVRLELVRRSDPGEAELWMLGEADLPHLEALLAGAAEEDLDHLALSVQADGTGRKFYVVREKRGRSRRYYDLGGRGFAAYKGLPNLYLPVDRNLVPELRRDRYRDLFGLRSGELALVMDQDGEASETNTGTGRVTLYRLGESDFEPLESLIDYLAAEADERLQELVKASVFDLGVYLKAPARSALEPLAAASPRSSKQEEPEPDAAPESSRRSGPEDVEPVLAEDDATDLAPDLETREIQAERALLAEGQSYERWLAVLEAKLEAGKYEDAALCFVDTLWLAPEGAVERTLFTRWHRFVDSRQAELRDEHLTWVTKQVVSGRHRRRGQDLDGWLRFCDEELHGAEANMRIKHRWLLWREILSQNQDVRQLARLRDELRALLASGLSQTEIPAFLRLRIFDDSRFDSASIGSATGADRSAARDLALATRNLGYLARGLADLEDKGLANVGRAVFARAYARGLGRMDLARDLQVEQEVNTQVPEMALAWHELYWSHTLELDDPELAAAHGERWQKLILRLAPSLRKALKQAEATLKRREKISNVTTFLSAENTRRLFPVGGIRASGELGRLVAGLRQAELEQGLVLLAEVFDQQLTKTPPLDALDLAELLDVTVDALIRFRWRPEAAIYLRRFESESGQLGHRRGQDVFYFVLKNNSLARGLAELGHEARAAELVAAAFAALDGSPVDVIDGCASLLNTVQGLELGRRGPLIQAFTRCVQDHLSTGLSDEMSLGPLGSGLFRLLDQAAEAAVSKEKLALGLFRKYQQHDEFLILERILREDPCRRQRK